MAYENNLFRKILLAFISILIIITAIIGISYARISYVGYGAVDNLSSSSLSTTYDINNEYSLNVNDLDDQENINSLNYFEFSVINKEKIDYSIYIKPNNVSYDFKDVKFYLTMVVDSKEVAILDILSFNNLVNDSNYYKLYSNNLEEVTYRLRYWSKNNSNNGLKFDVVAMYER